MKPLVTKVSHSVFCVQRRDYLSCSYIVVRDNGVILIDSGIDPSSQDMIDGLNEVGKTVKDVKAILLTHWHNDHSSGASYIQEASQADIYYHEDGHSKFTREARVRGIRGWLAAKLPEAGFWAPMRGLLELAPTRAVTASHFVEDGDIILNEFKAYSTPGHEIGHMSYYFEPEKVLFAGDALAVSHNRVGFMSRFLTHNTKAARQSMLRCLELDSLAICPGHRYPLINPDPESTKIIKNKLENLRWWPIIGC